MELTSKHDNRELNILAVAGFVLAFSATAAGLIVSIVALVQIRRKNQRGAGLAVAGIAISGLAIVIGAIILIYLGIHELLPWQLPS